MFGVLFGWRKASKCKKVIKEAQCRLKLLKIKRHSIVKHLREDTANLIKIGHEDIALNRAEQLIKDESVAAAYELIDNFCDFIRTHFSYIRRHKDCPDDINEAVSSLIYASARCGDLPELRVIRELFEERYGQKLAFSAVELFPGNLVNQQIKEALNMKFVTDDMKLRMVNEIATDYCLQRQLLALEYYPEWQQEVTESTNHHQVVVTDIQTSMDEREPEGKSVPVDSSPTRTVSSARKCQPQTRQGTEIKSEPIIEKASSSSESFPSFAEETLLVYLDDVEEFPSSRDEDSRDTRVFKFKSPMLSKQASFRGSFESWDDENPSPKSSSQRNRRRRTRRRLVYLENQGIEDAECSSYYAQRHKHNNRSGKVTPSASNHVSSNAEPDYELDSASMPRRPSSESLARGYSRAETMPIARPKIAAKDEFQRSNSCPVRDHPVHVHPKLPDCDELTARFLALKKEFIMNNDNMV